MTRTGDPDWLARMTEMLGERVRVVLDYDDLDAVAVGRLLSFDNGGAVVLQGEMGFKHYCWPLLKVEVLGG